MKDRFLLYIDILGFSNLVSEKNFRVHDLYEIIVSLNAHHHDAFKAVVFSDTILIYNNVDAISQYDNKVITMFLCEFARDLLHRLTGKGIFFRAIITKGEFTHYELNDIPCFFGQSLVSAYADEKKIKAIGLFMHKSVKQFNQIFSTCAFNQDYDFVFLTQAIQELEEYKEYPIDWASMVDTDLIWHLYPELDHISSLFEQSQNKEIDLNVVEKSLTTYKLYECEYPNAVAFFKASNWDYRKFCVTAMAEWQKLDERYPEDYSHAVKSRKYF